MPKRYKPSEKMPDPHTQVVFSVSENEKFYEGFVHQSFLTQGDINLGRLQPHDLFIEYNDGEAYSDQITFDQVDWWLDPMEEEE